MEKERNKTLKEYLDELTNAPYNVDSNATIIVVNGMFGTTRYEQPIRWFYCEPNHNLLESEIFSVDWDYTIMGIETLRIILKGE